MKNELFKKDLYRYYGDSGESFKNRLLRPMEIQYLFFFRKYAECNSKIFKIYCKIRIKHLSKKSHIQIPWGTSIGEGFYIGHSGRVIINPLAKLGKNINIATGVTIGQENRGKRAGYPTIKDNCWIGTNAVIVGNITIGTDVLIAPLAYVNFDVPDHSIVIGNPGRIIPSENATIGYITNIV